MSQHHVVRLRQPIMELINLVKCINAVRDSVQVLAIARAIISAIPFAKIRSKFDCMVGIVF